MGRHLCQVLVWSALLVITGGMLTPSPAAAANDLETRSLSTYDVNSDGSVHVTIAATVTNRDASTERRASGRVFFYTAAAFAVHESASNLSARSGPTQLAVETRDRDDSLRVLSVRFNRDLYFGESIDLTIEYDLAPVRAAQLLISRQYTFVPAIGQGARHLVRITAPADRRLTISSPTCARVSDAPTVYHCGASTVAAEYRIGGTCAFTLASPRWECAVTGREFVVIPFEASAAYLALATRLVRVPLRAGTIEMRVQHFVGDEAWAARVEDVIRRGLPILEEANGFAYPGPLAIEIVESGYRDTHGYEGLATTRGRIRLTPVVDDQTMLHELSHLWSGIYGSRWLAEGMADLTANIAARRLGARPDTVSEPLPSAPLLEEWGPLRSQLAVSRAEREAEEAGYNRSLRFLELLSERVGPTLIAATNATLAQERVRGTARSYLDQLEDLSGQSLAPLFAQWALTQADADLLPARAAARSDAATLRRRAATLGVAAPADLAAALGAWQFEQATRIVATGTDALDLHEQSLAVSRGVTPAIALGTAFSAAFARGSDQGLASAREEQRATVAVAAALEGVHVPRTPLMRLGLVGSHIASDESVMRAAMTRGDYRTATMIASQLQVEVDTAQRTGILRAALAVAGVVVIVVVAAYGIRRSHSHTIANRHRAISR